MREENEIVIGCSACLLWEWVEIFQEFGHSSLCSFMFVGSHMCVGVVI